MTKTNTKTITVCVCAHVFFIFSSCSLSLHLLQIKVIIITSNNIVIAHTIIKRHTNTDEAYWCTLLLLHCLLCWASASYLLSFLVTFKLEIWWRIPLGHETKTGFRFCRYFESDFSKTGIRFKTILRDGLTIFTS